MDKKEKVYAEHFAIPHCKKETVYTEHFAKPHPNPIVRNRQYILNILPYRYPIGQERDSNILNILPYPIVRKRQYILNILLYPTGQERDSIYTEHFAIPHCKKQTVYTEHFAIPIPYWTRKRQLLY